MTERTYNIIASEDGAPIKAWTKGVAIEPEAEKQLRNAARLPFIFKWIAAMPDVHLGIGATVGSVIPTTKAIIPAAVGVDIGCFTGDTLVPLLDGKNYSLRELAQRDGEFVVYACTPEGKIVAAKATARLTRRNVSLVKVVLDNGQEIKCTPDHQFMLRDGSYKEASRLEPQDSLMPLYTAQDREGYVKVLQPYSESKAPFKARWQRAHWIVARSGLLGDIPKFEGQRTIIHHKNFDEADNTPENLQFMGNGDHSAYHRGLVEKNTHWQSPEFEARRKRALRARADTPEGWQELSTRGTRNIVKYMSERPDHFKAAVAGNGQRGKSTLIAYNLSERGRAKSKELANRIFECELCGEKVKSPIAFTTHRRRKHGPENMKWKHLSNHRVVAVVPVEEREDVYCLTVPEYHNFALAAGVFVHNCGMMAVQTSLTAADLPDNLKNLRAAIEKAVPHGRTDNGGRNDRGAWGKLPGRVTYAWEQIKEDYDAIAEKHPTLGRGNDVNHLGTLGTGNHFIEVCLDEADQVWFMLHSGSRGVGNRIGTYFIELAKQDMRRYFINLPDENLAYLPEGTEHFKDYVQAVEWAQNYAMLNRQVMMKNVIEAVEDVPGLPRFEAELEVVNCHHNYVARENHFGQNIFVTRKGAVRARKGDLGIIPGSMGARSYIVRGLGNPESFMSCSHGAGRALSRAEAKRRFSVADHAAATAGIECRKDSAVIDETPAAYKPIDDVMNAQRDLVEVVHTLRQIVCVKG